MWISSTVFDRQRHEELYIEKRSSIPQPGWTDFYIFGGVEKFLLGCKRHQQGLGVRVKD